jgi:RNA polymerase primary sigma factor
MIELEREEGYQSPDLYDSEGEGGYIGEGSLGLESDEYSGLTRANYVDRVRFDPIPSEAGGGISRSDSPTSADPLYIYYRSMSKIRLLTREEEVYLAKKIESAKINTLRLLSLTLINTKKIFEMAGELLPVSAVPNPTTQVVLAEAKRDNDNEISLEERNRQRAREVKRILVRLERLEEKYRDAKTELEKARNGNKRKTLAKIKACRESVFKTMRRIDFSEDQISDIVGSIEHVTSQMEVSRHILSTSERNTEAGRKAVRTARASLREIEEQTLSNAKELRKILTLIAENKSEMTRAKDEFVRANLRLVLSIAKNYSYPGLDLLDLVQEGNIGLMKAVDKFNYRLGHKFSTYATWWIRQSITRAIADQGRTIRIPVHMVEAMNRVLKTSNELSKRLGREPSVHELAKELKTPVSKVTQILKAAQEPISLEASIADNKDAVLNKFIEDKNAISPDEDVMKHNLREATNSALQTLSPREQEIVRMRYGLNEAGKEYTLQEVGEMFQVTRERIRQIEEKALLKLRSPYRSGRLREFADFVSTN